MKYNFPTDAEKNNDLDEQWLALKRWSSVLAMIISFDAHHSISWAIIHGFCSWTYVIYYLLIS